MSKIGDGESNRTEEISQDFHNHAQEIVDESRERAKKVRKEFDDAMDEKKIGSDRKNKETEKMRDRDPNWWMSSRMKAIVEEGDRRAAENLEREKKAWDDVMKYFDDIRKAQDIGFDETIEMFQIHAVVSGVRIEKTARNQLLTEKDVEMVGEELPIEVIEEKVTNLAIKLLGLDGINMREDDKKVLARMVWGREMIIKSIIDQGVVEGVAVTRGDVTKNIDLLTFSLMENLGLSFEETRRRVSSLSGIMASEEGRKKMVKQAAEEME
ncbi:hypothetical protein ISR94_03945 [Candidatus Microgenomates bacterium]|nr:hypothetical protein [Candidatus Microgenomates bacterium]